MTHADYLANHFSADFGIFRYGMQGQVCRCGDDSNAMLVQEQHFDPRFACLGNVPAARRGHFLVALFFEVLIDQVMYTHFREWYGAFVGRRRPIKLKGNCPTGCGHHIHPSTIFFEARMWASGPTAASAGRPPIECGAILPEATELAREQVAELCRTRLLRLDPSKVWARCEPHLPSVGP